jgi:hypothetical protein
VSASASGPSRGVGWEQRRVFPPGLRIPGRGQQSGPTREQTVPTGFPPSGKRPGGNSSTRFSHSSGQAVRETVQQQEVQDLVLPGGRGRGELPPPQGLEVEFQQTFLDFLSHWHTELNKRPLRSGSSRLIAQLHFEGVSGGRLPLMHAGQRSLVRTEVPLGSLAHVDGAGRSFAEVQGRLAVQADLDDVWPKQQRKAPVDHDV